MSLAAWMIRAGAVQESGLSLCVFGLIPKVVAFDEIDRVEVTRILQISKKADQAIAPALGEVRLSRKQKFPIAFRVAAVDLWINALREKFPTVLIQRQPDLIHYVG